jgi:hypothetical protein
VNLKGRSKVRIEEFERYLKEKVPAFEEVAVLEDTIIRRLVGDCFEEELERVPARHWEELGTIASVASVLARVDWLKPASEQFRVLTPTLHNVQFILRDLWNVQKTILEKILVSALNGE